MITGNEMEVDHPVKVEDICFTKSRHARRKRLEINRLKSTYPSDDHDHVEDTTSCGMGMMKRNMKMKLGFCGGINYNKVVPACDGNIIDQTTQTDHHDHDKRDGLCLPSISLLGASKNDVPRKPMVGMLVNTVGGSDDFGRDGLRCNSHGSVSVCGRRREMEDTVTIIPGLVSSLNINRQFNHDCGFNVDDGDMEMKYDFYAVYDGHGGSGVANVCRDQLHRVLVNEIESCDGDEIDWENVMVSCFMKMDDAVSGEGVENEEIKSIGSTAVVSLISTDQIIVANCGDSRAVLSRGGTAIPLSQDHRPDRTDEMERVEAAGGRVINWNGYRVLGVLATSRSIGDHYLKPYVISVPEVTITSRTESDEFVILASDGLWDVMSNDMACNVARKCLEGRIARKFASSASPSSSDHTSNAALAAAVLAELAMAKGSKDNISVVVVELKKLNR
ncbi:hypothetical protein C5167_027433 [Papaver somniferum]|uniref:protein phosphatase 2C 51-like n=1 Tax=Papaver somniferum TaxID=3469 RepID=UPI000E6FDA33|nr:protein phosphatase 2C 51-like [Papaver somniferum]RZC91369.1 hypothetical protein C5167_027433 [Papaver somniferum]